MTTLHKLSIRGVRSYSPDTESIIKFQHPLTIIVGANGSGKTSIIECLKYVCSGEFPPLSDKGKSFVHDPDSCGEPIVKGQIKLAFKTSADKNVIAIKSFQVTAQKGRRTFKLIDSVLSTTDEQGQQKSVSYKCARMDELMTQLMGVTTPILENVIFCHQLDADWPLSDDKSLKKRFDDIFAATKYTRALESIKKIRSDQLSKSKDLQRDLDIIANNLETVQRIEADKSRTQQSLEMLTTKWEAAQRQKDIYSRSFTDLSEELAAAEEFDLQLTTLRRELQTMEQEVAQARKRLQIEFSESTPELIQRLSQFSDELDKRKAKMSKLEKEFNKSVRLEEEISARYQTAVKAAGKVEFLEQQHALKLSEARTLIESLPDEIRLSRELAESDDISNAVSKLVQFSSSKQRQIQKKKAEHKENLLNMEKQISSLRQQLQGLTQTEQLEKRQIELFSSHISNLDVDLTVTTRKHERMLPIKQQAEKAQSELDDHLKAVAAQKLEQTIEQYSRQLQKCNSELSDVNRTLSQLESTNEARSQISVQKKLYEQTMLKFQKTKDSVFETMSKLLGPNHPVEIGACLQQIKAALRSIETKASAIQGDERKSQDELLLLTQRRTMLAQKCQTAESQVAVLKQQIASGKIPSVQKVEELLQTRQAERDRLDHSIRNATEFANLFADWGSEAEHAMHAKKPYSCGLCDRAFSMAELQNFVIRNAERVRSLRSPEELQSMKVSLQQVDRRIAKLEHIRGVFQKVESGDTELSTIRSDLDEVEKSIKSCQQKIPELSKKTIELETSVKDHRQVQNQLESLKESENDLLRLEADLKQSQSAYQKLPVGDADEIHRRRDTLQSRSQTLSGQINDIRQQMLSNDEITRTLREKAQSLREEAGALVRVANKIDEIKQSIADYQERQKQAEATISRSREASLPIQQQIQSKVASRDQYESESNAEIRSSENALDSILSQQRQVQTINNEIQQISKELKTLRVTQDSISKLSTEAQDARSMVRDLQIQLQTQREAIAAFESDKRNLQDNIEYRKRLATYEKQRSLVEKMMGEGSLKYRDRHIIKKEFDQAQKMLMECERISASSQGERSALLSQLQSFESTLAEERYRNIIVKHRHAMIDLESTKLTLNDLDQYYRALDKALMDFHSIKMSEINQVLKELWQVTYRGNDIDAIAIRSDHAEGATTLGAGRQKKQYSYRLVMMQGDIELDMRGRSSAGQRVLASLLIRLALSETFCTRCGILALDEPTQNLDEANIRALADALNALIERRKGHENFQLILITHDENFVELLRKRDNADCYWRVFKDGTNCSRIKRIPINC